MSTGLKFDAAAARRLETVYLTSDVVAQRAAVLEALALEAGERVLDIGSGPGLLARDMAEAVARGVTGKDVTPFLLARLAEASNGCTPAANVALLEHNARLAGQIAAACAAADAKVTAG